MSQRSKKELVEQLRPRYRRSGRARKQLMLDEFCAITGHERKHAIKLLKGKTGRRRKPPGRKKTYGPEVAEPLKEIWMWTDQMCSKLLKAALPEWIGYYEERVGRLEEEVRRNLLSVSSSQIDRLLAPYRIQTARGRRKGLKPGSLIRSQVPIRTGPWEVEAPGYLEADTVAHGGGSTAGNFIWSITYTDVFSGWTCLRATWNRGRHGVLEQTRDMERKLPFELKGFDCDNGGEFLNDHLYVYLTGRKVPVQWTRSRPYRKNDNAHVEQKNWTHVRQLLGYERLEDPELVPLLNELYQIAWEPFHNFFRPCMKLVSKERIGSRYRKKYDAARTPYQRLIECGCLSQEQRAQLEEIKAQLNPITLKETLEQKLKQVFERIVCAA